MNTVIRSLKAPFGVYLLALFIGIQFSSVATSKVGGGLPICIIGGLGILLTTSESNLRNNFFNAIKTVSGLNAMMLVLLFAFYVMVVVSWIHSPYGFHYEHFQAAWKTHLMNIIAIYVGMYFAINSRYLPVVLFVALPLVLWQVTMARNFLVYESAEAREFLRAGGGFVLGTSSTYELYAMYAIMFFGYALETGKKLMIVGAVLLYLYFANSIVVAGYGTPVLLLMGGTVVFAWSYFFYGRRTKWSMIAKTLLVAGVLCGVSYKFKQLVDFADTEEGRRNSIANRFKSLTDASSGEGYAYHRFMLLEQGLRSFCENPLFGKGGNYPDPGGKVSGGHQALFDYFGHYGLLGGGSYLIVMIMCICISFRRYKKSKRWGDAAALAIATIYFVGGVVNPCWLGQPTSVFWIFCRPFKLPQQQNIPGCAMMPFNCSVRGTNYYRG